MVGRHENFFYFGLIEQAAYVLADRISALSVDADGTELGNVVELYVPDTFSFGAKETREVYVSFRERLAQSIKSGPEKVNAINERALLSAPYSVP